jgi:hypothetical protein
MGVSAKVQDPPGFSKLFGIILLKKNRWKESMYSWTGSTPLAHGAPIQN